MKSALRKFTPESALRSRWVLYALLLLSVFYVCYLGMQRRLQLVFLFTLVAFLTAFFSRNMVVVLGAALVATALVQASRVGLGSGRQRRGGVEGFEGFDGAEEDEEAAASTASTTSAASTASTASTETAAPATATATATATEPKPKPKTNPSKPTAARVTDAEMESVESVESAESVDEREFAAIQKLHDELSDNLTEEILPRLRRLKAMVARAEARSE